VPVGVTLPGPVRDIAAGDQHTCVVLEDTTVVCWGDNRSGQLGDGSTLTRYHPTEVPGLSGIESLGLGTSHSCAVTIDGALYCWGDNQIAQLGFAGSVAEVYPVLVSLSNVARVSASSNTCAITQEGSLYCWGYNGWGQSGSGSTIITTPTRVEGLTNLVDVGTSEHTCVLGATGEVRCWGNNDQFQVGDGTQTIRYAPPADPMTLAPASDLAVGGYHTCALTPDGAVYCWGRNLESQLSCVSCDGTAPSLAITGALP
jgi:alpha-tubulin suppressor-like RCC1 family protein